jgi:hypothetical protein
MLPAKKTGQKKLQNFHHPVKFFSTPPLTAGNQLSLYHPELHILHLEDLVIFVYLV